MRRYFLMVICVLSIFIYSGCESQSADRPALGQAGSKDVWTPTKDAKIINISTAEAFVENIGPDRTLELDAGEYVLSDVKDRHMDFVRWDPNFDGQTLTIRKVKGLKIIGKGPAPARLIVHPRYVFVLNFEDCKDIRLENLILGHSPEEGYCDSGVIGVANCQKITIRKCELFGCGTEGLMLTNVRSLSFEDSVIRDCSYGIMTIKSSADLSFTDSQFFGNREYYGISLHDSKRVVFAGCSFRENRINDTLFRSASCSDIVVKCCRISDNTHKGLTNNAQAVTFDGMKTSGR